MKHIGAIDVGGTTIKYGVWTGEQLVAKGNVPTPDTLESFYQSLSTIVEKMKEQYSIAALGLCLPSVVNKKTGFAEGISVLPYLHGFNLHKELEKRLGLPISMENDANCAALCELQFGVAKGMKNVLFLILGTGVGGTVFLDGKLQNGQHLFGGEFGFFLMENGQPFYEVGTAIGMAKRYNMRKSTHLTGEEVFQRAFEGDEVAIEESDVFFTSVAKVLFNLQYAFDPELIVLGGGVSQAKFLLSELDKRMESIMETVTIAPFKPRLDVCQFKNDANLLGAISDFL
ncbi:ROK family protein [Pilibacter termitis]|uniref:ROK family protein n=1 Tax=Pilibacter termitis TaxID=263852 RepID=A0A1T4MAK6_9ENTE|nr:ROK family protein [Pilibacter termitis]SJZ63982.1 ROK family protein [Pilibacter termitis]